MIKIKKFLPNWLYKIIINIYDYSINPFYLKSYSQEGEDLILNRIFEETRSGFFVDVGAHHPKRFSNTYFFYKKGWRGINIEARPGSKKVFDRVRPRDINLESAINSESKSIKYYMFNEPALNGFDKETAMNKDGMRDYKIIREIEIKTKTLAEVLDLYIDKDKHIDFLTVDVEGLDYKVLISNNWEKYMPSVILVEEDDFQLENIKKSKIYNLLAKYNYVLIAKTFNTLFFKIKS
jgi:FkbM family methyltransferase